MKIIIIILALSIFIFKNITTAYEFELFPLLEDKTSIQVAINVWNTPLIKSKIKDQNLLTASFFQDYDLSPSPTIPRRLKIDVFQIIENLELPVRQTDELIYIIEPIGKKLFDFLSDIHKKLGDFDEDNPTLNDYIDNIQWTVDGQIDHAKTLMAVFDTNVNKNLTHEEVNNIFMFVEACKYSYLYEIGQIWNRISQRDRQDIISASSNIEIVNIGGTYPLDWFTRATIVYWISVSFGGPDNMPLDPYNALGFTRGMLEVHHRDYLSRDDESFKFFLIQSRLYYEDAEESYILNTYLPGNSDIITSNNFVFLMQRLTREWRLEFLKINQEYSLTKLIDSWPWRYIFFDIFEESLINRNSTIIDYQNLLTKILDRIEAEYAVFRNSKQTSLWMLGKFWSDYRHHFSQGLIDTCWPWTNKQLSKYRVLTDIIRVWRIKHIDEKIINEITAQRFRIDHTQYYDSLYDIGEYILKTPAQRYKLMKPVVITRMCTYFIINGDRYDEIDRVIDWKFGGDDNKKTNYKISIKWILIIKKIRENEENCNFINRKLHLLIDWLNFTDKQRSELKDCINQFFMIDSNQVDWVNFHICIKKPGLTLSRKRECTSEASTSTRRSSKRIKQKQQMY